MTVLGLISMRMSDHHGAPINTTNGTMRRSLITLGTKTIAD